LNGVKFKDGGDIATKSEKIMLDTGLTYALVPSDDVKSVAKSLMGYSLNCEPPAFKDDLSLYKCSGCTPGNLNSLKPIELFIGGKYFDIPV